VEQHPKFEGHMTPNEDEYQKYVRLDTVLECHNSLYTVSQKKTSKFIFVITTSNFHQMW